MVLRMLKIKTGANIIFLAGGEGAYNSPGRESN